MNILFLHNKYLIGGGEDISTDNEIELLRNHGHIVDVIIADNKELSNNKFLVAINSYWSFKYYNIVTNLLESKKYDLIHVQNFFPQISPSIFYAAKRKGVKIVMSVRNYRLVCPNALLYIKDEICTKCINNIIPYQGVVNKCYKESYGASLSMVVHNSIHNILGTWLYKVDGYIAISDFIKEILFQKGIEKDKVFVKYNFLTSRKQEIQISANLQFIYVGRISIEKGINTLLKAFSDERLVNMKLIIVGDGPLVNIVQKFCSKYHNIIFLGKKDKNEVLDLINESRALVFPSEWYEPFGRTLIEAFSVGTPVIASNNGGIPEIVKDNYNGLVFESKDVESLIDKILIFSKSDRYDEMCNNALKTFKDKFSDSINYEQILSIYNKVLKIEA